MPPENSSPRAQKPARIGRLKITANIAIQFLIAAMILFMLNYLSFNHFRRWDFTRSHFYALSEKTIQVLGSLRKKVKVYIFFQQNSVIAPDVNNLLKEYQYRSNGKLDITFIDPFRDKSLADDLSKKYNLGDKDNVLIFDSGDQGKTSPDDRGKTAPDERTKIITDRDMVNVDTSGEQYGQGDRIIAFKGEDVMTSALLEITDDKPNILYAITGHGERDLTGDTFAVAGKYIERENVKIRPLNLQNADKIPADAGMLLILGAQFDLTERETKMLNDYWEKKGRLFILLDPNAQKQMANLMTFLDAQGVRPADDRIMRVARTQLSPTAAVAALVRDVTGNFVDGSPVTKNLHNATGLFRGVTQSLLLDTQGAQAAGVRLQMLVQATDGYWGETDYNINVDDNSPLPIFEPKKDYGQPLAVVASVEKGGLQHVQLESSRMIVSGNYEFISQGSLAAPNINFLVNGVDWLLYREELIGIAPKDYTNVSLNLSDTQMSHIMTTTMFIIPGVVGLIALVFWWRRRR